MFRYPDKPILSSHLVLPELVDGEWFGQFKYDGFRCLIEIGQTACTFTTRHRKPCPVSPAVADDTYRKLRHLPVGTILDAEWMARRAGDEERFWIFDLIKWGEAMWGDVKLKTRIDDLYGLMPNGELRVIPEDMLATFTWRSYANFFDDSKRRSDTEGIVLKHVNSSLKLSTRECYTNPMILKVKFRDGADGQKRIA